MRFDAVRRVVADALASHTFPGIVLLVEHEGQEILKIVEGFRQIDPVQGEAMSEDTLFDLASLTKPLATAILTLRHFSAQGLSLDLPLGDFIPALPSATARLTIRSLLLHTSGLPPVPGIYTSFPRAVQDPERARRRLYSLEPVTPAKARVTYSCTGYQFLGEVLRRRTGRALSELYREEVTRPLEILELLYNPGAGLRDRCAATEYCSFRGRWIRGEVHDENAWCMGGDAGNAGLFGSARAILRLLSLFSADGKVNGYEVLRPEVLSEMTTSATDGMNERRSCGFMLASPDCPAGPFASRMSFGHTGFTGTSIWVDPERRLTVVALTNRVHFGRDNTAESIRAFRRALHSEIFRTVDGG